ncbi:MAG: hypothetical protein L3K09_04225, partial [Thermoplasmata archaeon]|nr:hypothetical protein [Thermoplasmata archaeon]
ATSLTAGSVFANLSQLPGAKGVYKNPQQMSYSASTGLYTLVVGPTNLSSSGNYYIFVNATNSVGEQNSVAIPVTVGTASGTTLTAQLSVNNTQLIKGIPVTFTDIVTNSGGSSQAINTSFSANGVAFANLTGNVGAGAAAGFSPSYTPSATGTILFIATTYPAVGNPVSSSLNLTSFPKILFISHNLPAAVKNSHNDSALMAAEINAAGFPVTQMWIPCATALPASATLQTYTVVVIDFGSQTGTGCPAGPSAADQGRITGAAGVNFFLTGAMLFSSTGCASYSNAFLTLFGIGWTNAGGALCTTLRNAAAAASYNAQTAAGLLGQGIGTLEINQTLMATNTFSPYYTFNRALTNPAWMTAGGQNLGSYATPGTTKEVALATDPALLTSNIYYNGGNQTWGAGAPGTAVVYNVLNFLCGFSSSTSPGRATSDFAASGAVVVGIKNTQLTYVYVGARANGGQGGVVTAWLYVNGQPAIYQGQPVSATITLGANGASQWGILTWLAPAAATYTLFVTITTTVTDLFAPNNQLPTSIINTGFVFT